jgi:hypothetical protein
MPARKTKTAPAADTQMALDVVAETVSNTEATAIEPRPANTLATLPALDAPVVNTNEPAISYKIDFSDKSQWFASSDGGKTKSGCGSNAIAGCPIDLALQISKATWSDGYDQRLRLAFMQADGQLAEINLNAINRTQAGELYVTSPARSLVGGLLAISESDDDILAFCDGARFRVRPGRGKGVFVEVDIASNGQWIAMASPAATNQVAKDPAGLHAQLTLIKKRFRGAGTLLTAAAVTGEIAGYDSDLRLLESACEED